MEGSAVAIRLPLPLESLGLTSHISPVYVRLRVEVRWGVPLLSSCKPPLGMGNTVLFKKGGPTCWLPQNSSSWPVLNPSQPGVGQTSETLGSTSPEEPTSLNPRSLRRGSCLSNTNQTSFSAPHARQPKQASPLMGPHLWPKLWSLPPHPPPPDKFTEQ